MIKNLFKKDIYRTIEGVIKADNLSEEAVFQEVDEYVITKEIHKELDKFFSEYSSTIGKPTQSIGCWISGHFGSGKSHLLKILSYILSSDEKYDKLIKELFITKIDEDDFELKNSIKKALNSHSETILFNIDQKAEIGSKNQEDAILSVFMKVFNEMRGYYPKFGYIAKFESDLDKRGRFDEFKQKFKEISGESWEVGRETILLEIDNAAKALAEVDNISFESAKDAINKYEENYSLSIEEFAKEVKEYIEKKPRDFRLIFCVDEIGQYIGDNTKLMLNLQTIVETLSTECQGQAWVIVTSQSAVSDLVNSDAKMENDFSKILGRFKIKLNLTSQNANEVIQKRLLEKTKEAKEDLIVHYQKVENSLKSILRFSEHTRGYKSYENSVDFAAWYPFIPYQLDLFQSSIKNLSNHSVFQGRHQSTGERSMLDVVQTIAKSIATESVGKLVTFDMFFDGISGIIRAEIQTEINKAENILDEFSLKVLKTLFMIKYVKEFEANLDNIATLLVDNTQVNFSKLKENVQNALNRLLSQTYIQKVGDVYEYLTDTEKDIENEINSIKIDDAKLIGELANWLYDDIIKLKKIRYKKNQQDYNFGKKIDSQIIKGKEEELNLNIITKDMSEDELIRKSMGSYDLIVYMPLSYEFEKELEKYVQTNTYLPQKHSSNLSLEERIILQSKAEDNKKRRDKLLNDLKIAFEDAYLYFNGKKLNIATKDIKNRLESGFEKVIESIYPYISLLEKIYTENDISLILSKSDDLYAGSLDVLPQAEKEVLNLIQRYKNENKILTLSNILEFFQKRPYGWYVNAVLSQIASLLARKLIDIRYNSTSINKEEAKKILLNTRTYQSLIILPKTTKKVPSVVLEIVQEMFPNVRSKNDANELYKEVKDEIDKTIYELQNYKNLNYPFNSDIDKALSLLKELNSLDIDSFFDELTRAEDDILDISEEIILPISEFFKGDRRKIYDDIKRFLKENRSNLRYLDIDIENFEKELQEKNIYKSSKLQNIYLEIEDIKKMIYPLIEDEKSKAKKRIDELILQIQKSKDFQKVTKSDRYKIIKPIEYIKNQIDNSFSIDTIRQLSSEESINRYLKDAYEKMAEFTKEEVKLEHFSSLIPKSKQILETQKDVEDFINSLKENLLNEIKNRKKIIL